MSIAMAWCAFSRLAPGARCRVSPFAALERGRSSDRLGEIRREGCPVVGGVAGRWAACCSYLTQGMRQGAASTMTVSRAVGLRGSRCRPVWVLSRRRALVGVSRRVGRGGV